jgi:hypothetical protein
MNEQLIIEFSEEIQNPRLRVGDVSGSALLPPMGQMVIAKVKFTRNWPECLGGLKITFKEMLVMRIKSSANSRGWQWSGVESESFINGDVVSWYCR